MRPNKLNAAGVIFAALLAFTTAQACDLGDIVTKNATSRSVSLDIIDSTDGTPETTVAFNTSGIALWYQREGAAVTDITEATLAALTTAYSSGGFLAKRDGSYRLDVPDAAFATGANWVDIGGTVTGMIVICQRVRLVDYSLEDAVRGTTGTALPNAAAGASGGLPINGANAGNVSYAGSTTYTGTVSYSDGIAVARSTSNASAVSYTGNGTGHGLVVTSGTGATGDGFRAVAASTNGNGTNNIGAGTGAGQLNTGGATGNGANNVGGSTSGAGWRAAGTAGNSAGMQNVGQGSAAGTLTTGGATGPGASMVGGSTSGPGLSATSTSGNGATLTAGGNGNGLASTGSGTGAGELATAGATGAGVSYVGGSTSGNPISTTVTNPIGPVPMLGIDESGTAQSATATTIVLRSATSFPDNTLIGSTIGIIGGTGVGQRCIPTAWTSSTDTATCPTWTTTPDSTSDYAVWGTGASTGGGSGLDAAATRAALGFASANFDSQIAALQSDTDNLQTRVPTSLVSGRIDASVGAYQSGLTPLQPTTAGRTLDVTATGEAGMDWANIGSPTTTVNLSGTSTKALEPTVASRTLDVSTTGEAGMDWANIGSPTTSVSLSGTTFSTSQAVASVSGAVGSVTTVTDKTGYRLSATGIDDVWDEPKAGHVTASTYGVYLDAAISGVSTGGVSAATIADAVWDEATTGHTTSGTFGEQLKTDVDATLAAVDTEIASIIASLSALPTSIRDVVVDDQGSISLGCALASMLAYTSGDISTSGGNSTYKESTGTENRMTITVTSPGNRASTIICPTY